MTDLSNDYESAFPFRGTAVRRDHTALGLTVTAEANAKALAEAPPIEFFRTLAVELVHTMNIRATTCRIDDPNFTASEMFLTPPGGAESRIVRILHRDIVPDGNCLGDHSFNSLAPPLIDPPPGAYGLRMRGLAVSIVRPGGRDVHVQFPSVRIFADGRLVVSLPYPSPVQGAAAEVGDRWTLIKR